MKKLVVYLTTLLVVITSLALDVRGQEPVKSGLPERLPIGDIQSIRDWTITNNVWLTKVSVQLTYHDSNNTNIWGGNTGWGKQTNFNSYVDYVSYFQAEGMKWINYFRDVDKVGSESETYFKSLVMIEYGNQSFLPLAIDTELGPIDMITNNSFLNLEEEYPGVIIPVKNLEYFKLECGYPTDWPSQFWYTWDHGIHDLSWGGKSDYLVSTNSVTDTGIVSSVIITSKYNLATNRIRFTFVTEGKTNIYTQHGDSIFSPTSLVIAKDSVKVYFPRGADLTVQSSVDQTNWTTIYSLPWSAGTNFTSFPISVDSTTEKKFYRASVR